MHIYQIVNTLYQKVNIMHINYKKSFISLIYYDIYETIMKIFI
jgi:hypothetical protein